MDELIEAEETPVAKTAEQTESDATDLQAADEEWQLSDAAYSAQRTKELEDLNFEAGKHWSDADLSWKKEKKEPAFVVDQVSGQVMKIANQPVQRIIISPNGRGADPKTAELWQGICRRVENLSGAEAVYRWARRHAIVMGRGFWRVRADYFGQMEMRPDGVYDLSVFEQDLRIEPILNQHSVHPDPRCRMLDFSDQRFTIITDDLHWSEFKRLHPGAQYTTNSGLRQSVGDCPPAWANEKTIRVAERYYIVDRLVTLCVVNRLQPDGSMQPMAIEKKSLVKGEVPIRQHTFRIPSVKWMKYTRAEVLERADVPGRYIPVVMIVGERRIIDGVVDYRGMVRAAKDPQRLVDFLESRLASVVDLASYDTWLASVESVGEHTGDYVNAHLDRPGIMLWDRGDPTNPNPKPEHISVSPNISGIAVAAQRAGMSLRGVLGVPDVSPEETRPEQSGVAIGRRQQEQAQTTNHYGESTADGIKHTARILMSMGREIYDVPRILRINGTDEKPIALTVYKGPEQRGLAQQMAGDGGQDQETQAAVKQMLDISVGDFDVSVAAGKGYQSGRQEAVESLTAMIQAAPEIAPKAIPIVLKNSDFPGAQELAKALEPPDPNSKMVPVEQAQQAQQVIDSQTEIIHGLKDQLDDKKEALASAERISADNNLTKVQIAQIQSDAKTSQDQLDAHIRKLEALIGVAHEARMQVLDHAHEHATNAAQAAHAATMAANQPAPEDGAPV